MKNYHHRRRALAGVCAATLSGVMFTPALADSGFSIDQAVIVSGAATIGNGCSRLSATIGQPAVGFSSGGTFSLSSGFQAINAGAGDTIFFNSFEGCTP